MDNKLHLVDYELASQLFALGYNKAVPHYFTFDGESRDFGGTSVWYTKIVTEGLPRPTLLEALNYLYEKPGSRVFPTQKIAGDFGVEIYVPTDNPAAQPFKRESHFIKHFSSFEEALCWGIKQELEKIIQKELKDCDVTIVYLPKK